MFCESCGAVLQNPNQKFCPNCGTPLRKIEEDVGINEELNSDKILLFVDPKRYRIWMWHGKNTSIHSKFLAAQQAPRIIDKFGPDFKISPIKEGSEPSEFWSLIDGN